MDGYSQSNDNMKMAISLTVSQLAPLIKASQNHMPVENLLTYTNDIGILARKIKSTFCCTVYVYFLWLKNDMLHNFSVNE